MKERDRMEITQAANAYYKEVVDFCGNLLTKNNYQELPLDILTYDMLYIS